MKLETHNYFIVGISIILLISAFLGIYKKFDVFTRHISSSKDGIENLNILVPDDLSISYVKGFDVAQIIRFRTQKDIEQRRKNLFDILWGGGIKNLV